MDKAFGRTSVTVDEAVAILLGWASGPIVFSSSNQNVSDEEQDELANAIFSLSDELEDRQYSCENVLQDAKDDGLSEVVIAEKRSAIKQHHEVVLLANAYLCAVKDEINKGDRSGLRIDRALTNAMCTYVTLTSLDEWMQGRYRQVVLVRIEHPIPGTLVQSHVEPKLRIKLREQEGAIVHALEELGHELQSLPRNVPGKRGVKAEVKTRIGTDPVFTAVTSFEKAWERCLKGDIHYAA